MMRSKYDTVTLAPFCASAPSIDDIVKIMLAVLLPQILMLAITKSFLSLILIAVSSLGAAAANLCYSLVKKKKPVLSLPVLLQGICIGFFIPASYPLVTAFIVTVSVIFFQKLLFDGFAQSWFNVIAVGVIIMYFMYPKAFPPFLFTADYFRYANAGIRLFSDGLIKTAAFDESLTGLFNTNFFDLWGISIPQGYMSLLWDSQSPIPAFRFNILTLAASLILVAYKSVDALIPFVFIAVYALLVRFFSLYPYGNIFGNGDILLAVFTSGTLFAAFFILTWFGTIPLTFLGKIIYSSLAGIVCFFICGGGTSPIGMVFTILTINVCAPLIQYLEDKFYDARLRKKLIQAGLRKR